MIVIALRRSEAGLSCNLLHRLALLAIAMLSMPLLGSVSHAQAASDAINHCIMDLGTNTDSVLQN
jgi:hypothetical protein